MALTREVRAFRTSVIMGVDAQYNSISIFDVVVEVFNLKICQAR